MRFLEYLKRAFIVRQCVICDNAISYEKKIAICEDCMKYWISNLDVLCDKCGYESEYCTCVNKRLLKSVDFTVFCVFYKKNSNNPVKNIVFRLKQEYRSQVFNFCADLMVARAKKVFAKHNISLKNFVVTFPPRRKRAVSIYGYDHSYEVAKLFAKKLGLSVEKCFINSSKKEQKKLTQHERFINAKKSYSLKKNIDPNNKNYILIDDVLTTGSTLNACASLLKENGAKYVVPVCYAKDI
ncbi:MAG: ComF family protein [Clostridia bacterium]|nr:ComF family protein [Clostridia bacterium]